MSSSDEIEPEPHKDEVQPTSPKADESTNSRPLPAVLNPRTQLFEVVSIAEQANEETGRRAARTSVIARCRCCLKAISGHVEVTSNFVTHLKRMHPEKLDMLEQRKKVDENRKRMKVEDHESQPKVISFFKKAPPAVQDKVDAAIMSYIVHARCPLSTVDKPHFVNLVNVLAAVPSMNVSVVSRRVVTRRLDSRFEDMKDHIRKKIAAVDHVACTADIWSAQGRSFMGITLHYFDEQLQRVRLAIACKRFKGSHTFDATANSIESIFEDFGLLVSRVKLLTTDNATNFVKAFQEFSSSSSDGEDLSGEASISEANDGSTNETADVEISLMPDYTLEQSFRLPPHERCASHTLSLVVVNDTNLRHFTSADEVGFADICRSALGKCTSLWNKISRSHQARETCELLLKRILDTPSPTRWNSLFDSLKDLLRDRREDLNNLMMRLKIRKFSVEEYKFLNLYRDCVEPIANTLDILQGDETVAYGCLLPAIRQLCSQLRQLRGSVGICEVLRRRALNAVENRFADLLDASSSRGERALVSAVSHPFFKLRFLAPHERENARNRFTAAVKNLRGPSDNASRSNLPAKSPNCSKSGPLESFFQFDEAGEQNSTNEFSDGDLEVEIAKYLADDQSDLNSLRRYENISEVFRVLNVGLPSSAPVERLFSCGGLTLTDLRGRLSDSHLEMLVLFHYNNYEFK